jgi:hypothetical protein
MGALVVQYLQPEVANQRQPSPGKAPEHAYPHLGHPRLADGAARVCDPNVSAVSRPGAGSRADHRPPYRHQPAADRA